MFVQGSDTSEAAFHSVEGRTSSSLRQKVLTYLSEHGPSTDEEMQLGLGMNPSTQRPRRIELVRMGLVVSTGATRATKSGREAILWTTPKP